jgi:aerobic-type carbon monoxide dehydrogenase small subunit (CoxS/CutS family)
VTPSRLALTVNGQSRSLEDVPGEERLLDTLRWRLGLKGTKEGCRTGGCGACAVLVDGASTLSCLTLSHEVEGARVTTVEGVADDPVGRTVQAAFREAGALQCGYCTPGFVMTLTALLKEEGRSAATERLLAELGENLCRCTGYASIVRAVELVQRRVGP